MSSGVPAHGGGAFTGQVLGRISSLALAPGHPRVFVDAQALLRLRNAAARGGPSWESIREDADQLAASILAGGRPRLRENEPDGGALSLAFAFAVWAEPSFLQAVQRLLSPVLDSPSWVAGPHKGLRLDLRSAVVGSSLALTCDLLGTDLSAAERSAVAVALESRVLSAFAEIWAGRLEWWTTRRMNWQAVIGGHVGLALLAQPDTHPAWRQRLRMALEAVLDFLDHCPADGSFAEGPTYWHYGVGELAWFALGLRTATGGAIDLFQHPYLRATQLLPLYLSTPDGCFDFEDSFDYRMDGWFIALLAREYRNPQLQGLVAPFSHRIRPPRKIDAPARGMRHVLCHDPQLPALGPETLPPSRHFPDTDLVTMRSDWSPDATFVALQGGSNCVPHGHLDAGSFIVGGRGHKLLPDGGFWPYTAGFFEYKERRWDFDGVSTFGHNLLLVDERGQGADAACRARLEHVQLGMGPGPRVDWVVCDITDAYADRLHRHVRYLALVSPRSVIVVDDILCIGPRRLRWLLQYRGQASLHPTSLTVSQPGARANVCFPLLPGPLPYCLSREVRQSHYVPNVDDGRPQQVQFVSLSPLPPVDRWLVAAVIDIGDGSGPGVAARALPAPDGQLRLQLTGALETPWTGCFDLEQRRLDWEVRAAG